MDLDSFFAKKDRKKGKAKKFATQEDMAKRLEENDRKEEKAVQAAVTEAHIQRVAVEPVDLERAATPDKPEVEEVWKDFEEKVQVDVSDLKIANLDLSDEENEGSDANDEDGSQNGDGNKDSVWNVEPKALPTICDAVDIAMEDGKDVKETVAAMRATEKSNAVYVPPAMVAAPLPKGGRRKKNAPDLTSDEMFPTLGQKIKKKPNQKNGISNNMTAVKGGSKSANNVPAPANGSYVPPHMRNKTSNRFGKLTDHGDRF